MGHEAIIFTLGRISAENKRGTINVLSRRFGNRDARRSFAESAWGSYQRTRSFADFETAILAWIVAEDLPRAAEALANLPPHLDRPHNRNRLRPVAILAAFELGDYTDCVAVAKTAGKFASRATRRRYDFLKAAYAAGILLDRETAIEMFARQYNYIPYGDSLPQMATYRERLIGDVIDVATVMAQERLSFDMLQSGRVPRVGYFFLASTSALGHAILDPYYFLAMHRERFDRIIFIGPPKAKYSHATRIAIEIVEQYGDYCEVIEEEDPERYRKLLRGRVGTGSLSRRIEHIGSVLLNLSWMSLEEFSSGQATAVIDNYWSLLRAAVHRTRNTSDSFRHNAWFMVLPEHFESLARPILARAGIDLDQPLVVLHARDSGYHQIHKQSYRDAHVADYVAAINELLDRGYQVVRIGDRKMPRLDVAHERYHELPFIRDYNNMLDPVLIARAAFMIGCQSGPCAYARALGIPLLSINAVAHYTLLPSSREMACFKRYFKTVGGERRELPMEEALSAGVAHFENTYHFEEAGIEVVSSSPDEIVAAVKDMLAWMADPDLPESAEQRAFRLAVEKINRDLMARGCARIPIADYLGIVLDGYRISPSVARMRCVPKDALLLEVS
jgi:putative glycosyltransferase (TIGR04372 family)